MTTLIGNGEDCHRTWEALLLGSIPVVRHGGIDSLFQDSPIFILGRNNSLSLSVIIITPSHKLISDEWDSTYKSGEKFLNFTVPNLSKKHVMAQYWFDRINTWRDK